MYRATAIPLRGGSRNNMYIITFFCLECSQPIPTQCTSNQSLHPWLWLKESDKTHLRSIPLFVVRHLRKVVISRNKLDTTASRFAPRHTTEVTTTTRALPRRALRLDSRLTEVIHPPPTVRTSYPQENGNVSYNGSHSTRQRSHSSSTTSIRAYHYNHSSRTRRSHP